MARSLCSSNYPSLVTNEHCGGERAPLRTRRADVRKRMNVRGCERTRLSSTRLRRPSTLPEESQFGFPLVLLACDIELTLLFTQAYSYVTLSFTCAMHPDDNDSEAILFSPTLHRSPGSRHGHSPIQPVIFRRCGGSCVSMQRKRWSQGADGQTGRIARLCADPNARSISFPFHFPHT